MSAAKMGRPTDNPKDTMLRIRVDKDTLMMLDECAKANDTTRSDAVRLSIRSMYNKIKKQSSAPVESFTTLFDRRTMFSMKYYIMSALFL